MSSDPKRVQAMFLAAVEWPGDQRFTFLERECAGDMELRQRVEALLKAHDDPTFLERPAAALGPTAPSESQENEAKQSAPDTTSEAIGSFIGPYRLLQRLGEGGMGSVYVAEQEHPVKRRVALKIIKPGMDSAQVLRRFEAERQALALMDHTNIAKVLDAGTTTFVVPPLGGAAAPEDRLKAELRTGRPYFVMELVKGVPITKYCDELHLPIRERLELFVPVCQAIQHAHHKGIIHRDLKPSNVLVCMQDGKPVPKVIDFGVAKALHQKLAERTMYTEVGAMVGTLEYMSPEQAELSALDIDTRADVYALGVLLYELLTGTTPLDRRRLRSVAFDEMLRIIKEEEPPKPSTRLTQSKESLANLAVQRRTEPARLMKEVRGDLDWIVMKCLEKDRTRRYETANGLARDIDRYLHDEPVEACPPSAAYKLRKFARKHRTPLGVATLVAALLVAGVVVSAALAVRARHAESLARAEEHRARAAAEAERTAKQGEADQRRQAEAQKRIAEEKEQQAKEAEAEAKAVLAFFQNRVLAAGRPQGQEGGLGKDVTLRNAVDAAEPGIAAAFQNQPLVEASVRNVLGLTYSYLGEHSLALRQHEQALALRRAKLGPDHPDTLTSMSELALAYRNAGKLQQALPLHEETLKLTKAKLGPEHLETLISMNNLASAYQDAGKVEDALPLFEETLKRTRAQHGADHPHTLATMNNLALAYQEAGKLDQALSLFEETLKLRKARLGSEHPDTLTSMNNLALAYQEARRLEEALPLFEETLKLRKSRLGSEHPHTLASMNNLGLAYQQAGRLNQAVPLHEETLKLSNAKFGQEHPETLRSMNSLAGAYRAAGKLEQALPLFEETLKLAQMKLGPDHPQALTSMNNLAGAYQEAGKLEQAVPLFEESLRLTHAKLGPEHPHTLQSMNSLAAAYLEAGKFHQALPLLEPAFERHTALFGPDHPDTRTFMRNLALAYVAAKQSNRGLPLLKDFLSKERQRFGADDPRLANALALVSVDLLKHNEFFEAERLLRECLAIREGKEPDAWRTFNTKSLLGAALQGQKNYADAEPLLLQGYEGMKQREARIPANAKVRLPDALERLVQLYEAWDKPSEAVKWRTELRERKARNH
jgi:serine/threonine protein kinase